MYPVFDRLKSVIPISIVIPSNCARGIRREESRLNLQFKLSLISFRIINYRYVREDAISAISAYILVLCLINDKDRTSANSISPNAPINKDTSS